MRDYTKLVILGSAALLVLLAVILLLAFPHGDSSQVKPTTNTPPAPPKTDTTAPNNPTAGSLPETLDLGKDYALPCEATLETIVEKYYKGVTLHDNTVKAFKPEQIPLVTERLKKLNNIVDAKAKIPKGTTLHLPRLYVVSPGQTLSAISTDVYGNTKKVDEIFAKNTPDPVKKKNELSPGMVLILP